MRKQYFFDHAFFPKLVGFLFGLFLLTSAVKLTLNFRPLYYFDVTYLKITEKVDLPKEEIIKNYDVLIDYLKTTYKGELEFPSFSMSEGGRIHFIDVKNIFVMIDFLMLFSLALSFVGILKLIQLKNYEFLKWSAFILIALPLTLSLPLLINFNQSFIMFHQLFFSNDYWQFSPYLDPVILILPEEFFMHNAFLILFIIILESSILYIGYRYIVNKVLPKHI